MEKTFTFADSTPVPEGEKEKLEKKWNTFQIKYAEDQALATGAR